MRNLQNPEINRIIKLISVLVLLIIVCTIIAYYVSYLKISKTLPDISIKVFKYNDSALLIKLYSTDYRGKMSIGDDFANTNKYLELISHHYNDDSSVYYHGGILEYIINFPIYWFRDEPYCDLLKDEGVCESVFLFFKPISENAYYDVNFLEANFSIFNSQKGLHKKYLFTKDELFSSYFIFGNYSSCSKNFSYIQLNIIFANTLKNTSFCNEAVLLFHYYYTLFGNPFNSMNHYSIQYNIGIVPAHSFSSLSSGFFRKSQKMDMISHELFHIWQPHDSSCSEGVLFREGLAAFMQISSLYDLKLIDKTVMEDIFSEKMKLLENITNRSNYYSYSDDQLFQLRKTEPELYYILVYYRGALIWKLIQDSGISVTNEFRDYILTKNCSLLSMLFSDYKSEFDSISSH